MTAKVLNLSQIADMTGGTLIGDPDYAITSISALEQHKEHSISPLWENKFLSAVEPGMVLITKKGWIMDGCSGVEVDDPRKSLVSLLAFFDPHIQELPNVHISASLSSTSVIGKGVHIGPNCVVSDEAEIGDGCVLTGNVWVGRGVKIDSGTRIESGVSILDYVTIGKGCIIHSNAVIGSDGFGFMPDGQTGLLRIPQIGRVTIEDNVEIGACTCIDRATFGDTHVASGTKIDALVKIGHNCRIGHCCIIVSQSGIAGSSTLGNGVTMAAQSGIANHAAVGDGVTMGARSGVIGDIEPRQTISGFPARDHRLELRQMASLRHLADMADEIKKLRKRISALEEDVR